MKKKVLISLSAGFTLIELLIAIGVMVMVVGIAFPQYRRFNQRQSLVQSAKNIEQALRSAQKKARVGEKPTGCEVLQGYSLRANAGTASVTLYAICSDDDYLVTSYPLVGNATLDQSVDITYKVLTGGADGDSTIVVESGSQQYQFTITAGGEIEEGDYND